MFVQEVYGLLVPRNFKRMATVDTDGGVLLLDELLRYLVFAVIEPLVIYMFLLFIFFMYQYLNLIIFLLCIIMVIIFIP